MADSWAKAINADNEISPEVIDKWFQENIKHHEAKPKLAKLHFFAHEEVTADHPTNLLIAPANTGNIASTQFGSTYVLDAPLTSGSDPTSKLVGRMQGSVSYVGQAEPVLSVSVHFVFTQGEYKDSSLCVLARNPISQKYRELPVLGGTGAFRLARGTAVGNTFTVDSEKLNAVVEFHVVVRHY
ncbi:OLC1v1007906C1 [Oldenlandia corymbosa var. corymbosa]|uniref:Dirigent protein n=1 Tax=Oldenlandia corymbosa var. corymbosa TaxID=529605 RepID=A0AAV1DMT1_OLDCO|nr:OLC1v1007906C1 [Oldenlandia corymbosa var. corymbosa]